MSQTNHHSSGPIDVLHVDDQPDILELSATFLERDHDRISVVTETSATAALERLSAESVDCIVSDYQMPGMDGMAFLERVREEYPDLPFILFTGRGSEEVASDAVTAGVTDYLQKKMGSDQYTLLANRIENAVDRYRAERRATQHARINATIRDINSALVRATTREEIETAVCDILASSDRYAFAWVGEPNAETAEVDVSASAGTARSYLDDVTITTDDSATARGPAGRAVRTGELQVASNLMDAPEFEPWRDQAREYGFRSSAGVPLVYDDTVYGVLGVYARRPDAFDATERSVLSELGETIGHAINARGVRSRAERTRRKYETLVEAAPGAIFVADADSGRIVETNTAGEELLGRAREEVVGLHQSALHPPEHEDQYRELFEDHVEGGVDLRTDRPDGGQIHVVTDSGEKIPVAINARVVEFDGTTLFQAIFRDLREESARERDLAVFRQASEQIGVGVAAYGRDGHLKYVNPAYAEMLGTTRDRLVGEHVATLNPEFERDRFDDYWDSIDLGETTTTVTHHRRLGDGTELPVETATTKITNAGEDLLVGTIRDVSERRERRQQLQLFREAVERAGHVVFITDASGTIQYVNPAFEETTGYAVEEAIGDNPSLLKSGEHDTAFYNDLWTTVLGGEVWEGEIVNERKDGGRYHIDQTIAPITGESGDITHFVAVNHDITDIKATQEKLQRQNDRLEQFGRTVAHDLRNPLNVVAGNLQLARERDDNEFLRRAEESADRMETLVDELLELAKQGRSVVEPDPVSIEETATMAWANVDTAAADLAVAPDETICADENRLAELLENLFRNAIEHGGEQVSVTVGVLDDRDGFYVADDGPGIPEEDRDRVLDSGFTTSADGTGFGLCIVKQIADGHRWDVNVTAGADGGARFEFVDVDLAN